MCIYTPQLYPKIAAKDITCYKIVRIKRKEEKDESGKLVFYSAVYTHNSYKLNTPRKLFTDFPTQLKYHTDVIVSTGPIKQWQRVWQTGAGFYSYASTRALFYNFKHYELSNIQVKNTVYKYVVVKCVIPKGSRYYVSRDKHEYCSDQIILVGYKEQSKGKWLK